MKESITINKVGLISTANNTPAITIVLGWGKADTGEGALVADIDRELKGNWADFEKKIKIKRKLINNPS